MLNDKQLNLFVETCRGYSDEGWNRLNSFERKEYIELHPDCRFANTDPYKRINPNSISNLKTKQAIINKLYDACFDSTRKVYRDEGWLMVDNIKQAIINLNPVDYSFYPANDDKHSAGYSIDGTEKMWNFDLTFLNCENKEIIIRGNIRAFPAGTTQDKWCAYDGTVYFY